MMITLDIFSDPVCPWCLIGKTNLERALEASPDHPFVIAWHPFQLNPDAPAEGVVRKDYLTAKFGAEKVAELDQRLTAVAASVGIQLDLDKITTIPNTFDAHRLIHWAGLEGKQSAMVSALLRAYWREGRDIGLADVLADLAAEVGMDRAAIARLLASDADVEEIENRIDHARARGVTAVPCFIVGNQHAVSGAQPVELWKNVIAELTAELQATESLDEE